MPSGWGATVRILEDMADSYAEIWIIKEAMEKAGSADTQKVRDALASLDITSGPSELRSRRRRQV